MAGRLWENEDGRQLLHSMLQLGVALHGSAALGKTKEAVATFQEMIELDGIDHLVSEAIMCITYVCMYVCMLYVCMYELFVSIC